jgi:hypothetical protein
MLDQVFEQGVGQAFLVTPLGIAKNAVQVSLVRRLNAAHGVLQRGPDIARRLAHILPMAAFRNLETVLVGKILAVKLNRFLVLLVPNIADALEEEQRQDVAFPVGAVHRAAAQDIGRFPQVGFQSFQGNGFGKERWLDH